MDDLISRKHFDERVRLAGGMIEEDLPEDFKEGVLTVLEMLKTEPSAQPGWIPCSERMPAEDEDVLISYRYKEGEGDASHINVDITSYGQMYFGGNKVGDYKHWRIPFEFFESNYEVIAWMPLPEPYKERRQDD